MNKLYKLTTLIKDFFKDLKAFGFIIATRNFLWPYLRFLPSIINQYLIKSSDRKILDYLSKNFSSSINSFKIEKEIIADYNSAIWFCWLQGEKNMPKIVQTCLASLKRHTNNHPIKIITLANYRNYINLPDFIIQKYLNGKIKNAHFADILRTCLLYEHGGIWIDSTLLITKELPETIFKTPFYSCKFNAKTLYITQCKWSNFFLCAQKQSPIFAFTRNLLFEYIRKEERFINYFLMDYIIYLGYSLFPEIKNRIDQVPLNNENVHKLSHIINKPLAPQKWLEINENTYLFKLSWKTKYIEFIDQNPTFWHYIKQNII